MKPSIYYTLTVVYEEDMGSPAPFSYGQVIADPSLLRTEPYIRDKDGEISAKDFPGCPYLGHKDDRKPYRYDTYEEAAADIHRVHTHDSVTPSRWHIHSTSIDEKEDEPEVTLPEGYDENDFDEKEEPRDRKEEFMGLLKKWFASLPEDFKVCGYCGEDLTEWDSASVNDDGKVFCNSVCRDKERM